MLAEPNFRSHVTATVTEEQASFGAYLVVNVPDHREQEFAIACDNSVYTGIAEYDHPINKAIRQAGYKSIEAHE